MTDRIAASAALSAVQAAVDAAVDGDRVLIPNGTASWSSGITTTKQIIIQAQNYTPTPAGCTAAPSWTIRNGATSRNVTITANNSIPLISFTTGNSHHVGVGGIRFNAGTSTNNYIYMNGSGSKPPLIFDCYFEIADGHGSNNPSAAFIAFDCQGGVMWNCVANGIGAAPYPGGSSIWLMSPRAFNSNSTMGDDDTTGLINVYVEDCTWTNFGQSPDVDSAARFVCRHSVLDGCGGLTHGFTSGGTPGRHVEYYDNRLVMTYPARDENHYRSLWLRGGTGIMTDNYVDNPSNGWSGAILLDMGDNTTPSGGYPQARQVGMGYEGGADVSDPVYLWNNSGPNAHDINVQSNWSTYIQANRDYFDNTAKSGYAKYTYPHPLRSVIEGGALLSAPTNLRWAQR